MATTLTARLLFAVRSGWYAWGVTQLVLLVVGIDLGIVTLLVKPIELALHIGDTSFAFASSIAVSIGIAVSYYPGGVLADTYPRRTLIGVGVVIWSLAALGAAHTGNVSSLSIMRFFAGVGTGIAGPAIFSLITDSFEGSRRALAISFFLVGAQVGTGMALTLCGGLVAATQRRGAIELPLLGTVDPWQQCFLALAGLGVLTVLIVASMREPARSQVLHQNSTSLVTRVRDFTAYLGRHWRLWLPLWLGFYLNATIYGAVQTWGPALAMRVFAVPVAGAAALLGGAATLGGAGGAALAGVVNQGAINRGRGGAIAQIMLLVAAISSVAGVLFPLARTFTFAIVGITVVALTASMLTGSYSVVIQETTPNDARGQVVGVGGLLAIIAGVLGAGGLAFFAEHIFPGDSGYRWAFVSLNILCGIASVVLLALIPGPYVRARREMTELTQSPVETH